MTSTRDILVPDAWLAENLGRPCFALSATAPAADAAAALAALPAGAFAFAKVPAADASRAVALQGAGMRVVDAALVLERRAAEAPAAPRDSRVRFAAPADADAVAGVAGRAFAVSRFHLDPSIGVETANRLKAAWARGFFAGARGDAMVVAEQDGAVVGFLQLLRSGDGALSIDLIGVARDSRGHGLGEAMIALAQSEFAADMRVGTQAANTGAARFYERLGFRLAESLYVLHYHAGGAA